MLLIIIIPSYNYTNSFPYCTGTSPGATNPCHKTLRRFKLLGGPIKINNDLITVSPNTSLSSDVASKSLSNDGQCAEPEDER